MSIYDFTVKDINQNEVSLKAYEGKVLLIINSATKCGLTPQYEGLEDLYQSYKAQGFEVLDFPCNQFMNQAPGSDQELASFCQINFHTTFQTFSKIKVNGKDQHPLYKFLKNEKKKDDTAEEKKTMLSKVSPSSTIKWNFTKFLVDRQGRVIKRFAPSVLPISLKPFIEELL